MNICSSIILDKYKPVIIKVNTIPIIIGKFIITGKGIYSITENEIWRLK